MSLEDNHIMLLYTLFTLALLYGVLFVLPIGGADMPVVISLLNSFTGVAAAFAGFLYNNQVMLTGGILVGSAGTILTVLMCKAMNRSLLNVIIGSFGGGDDNGFVGSSVFGGGDFVSGLRGTLVVVLGPGRFMPRFQEHWPSCFATVGGIAGGDGLGTRSATGAADHYSCEVGPAGA